MLKEGNNHIKDNLISRSQPSETKKKESRDRINIEMSEGPENIPSHFESMSSALVNT